MVNQNKVLNSPLLSTQVWNAALFDLDGTLADSLLGIAWAAQAAVDEVFPGRKLPDIRPLVGPPIKEIFRRALQLHDEKILVMLEAAFRQRYNGEGWRKTILFVNVLEVLTRMHAAGWHLGVVTNKPLVPTQQILTHLGLKPMLAVVVTPDSRSPTFGNKTEALASLATNPLFPASSTIFIGDSPDDAGASAACGFTFVAAGYGYGGLAPAKHLHFINQFSDLLNIMPTLSSSR